MVRDAAGSYGPMLFAGATLGAITGLLMLLLPRFPGMAAQAITGAEATTSPALPAAG